MAIALLNSRILVVCLALCPGTIACRDGASEPSPSASPAPTATPRSSQHESHRIVPTDHRRVLVLNVDDRIVLPADPIFDWRVNFEEKPAFAPFTEADAGGEAYRVTTAGLHRIMVFGDPKCLRTDAACTLSKRRWDVTLDVR